MRLPQYLTSPREQTAMAKSMNSIMPLHNTIRRALYDGKVMHRQLTPLDEDGNVINELIQQAKGPQ